MQPGDLRQIMVYLVRAKMKWLVSLTGSFQS